MGPLHQARVLRGSRTGEQLHQPSGWTAGPFSVAIREPLSATTQSICHAAEDSSKLSKLGNSQPPLRVPRSPRPQSPQVFLPVKLRRSGVPRLEPHPWWGRGSTSSPPPQERCHPAPAPQGHTQTRHPGVTAPKQGPSQMPIPGPRSPALGVLQRLCTLTVRGRPWVRATDRRSLKPVSLAAAAAQTGLTVARDTWFAEANRVRSLPAPPRPSRGASLWESGCHQLQGKGVGEGALLGNLPPPTWVCSDPRPDASRGKGTWQIRIRSQAKVLFWIRPTTILPLS